MKKKNRKVSLVLGLAFLLLSIFLTATVFLQDKFKFDLLYKYLSEYTLAKGSYSLLSLSVLSFILGLLFLVFRKKSILTYIMIPYILVFYLTLMVTSHRILKIEEPVFIMERVIEARLSLLFVLILLETILAFLIIIILQGINERYKAKLQFRARSEKKQKEEEKVDNKKVLKTKDRKSENVEPPLVEDEQKIKVPIKYDPENKIEFPSFRDMPVLDTLEEDKARLKTDKKVKVESFVNINTFNTVKEEVSEKHKTETPSTPIDFDKPKTFKKGGILEASLESVTGNNVKREPVVNPNPIIGFDDVKEKEIEKVIDKDNFAPSNLPKSHPRYKLFEALKRKPKTEMKAEPQVSYFPSKTFESEEKEVKPVREEKIEINQEPVIGKKLPAEEKVKDVESQPYPAPVKDNFDSPKIEVAKTDLEQIYSATGIGGLSSNNEGITALARRAKFHYQRPPLSFLKDYPSFTEEIGDETIMLGNVILQTMADFHIEAEPDKITVGPTVTMFEYKLAPGILVSKLNNIQNNLSMNLRGRAIRILTQIPGKQTVGIEVANTKRQIVGFKDLLPSVEDGGYKIPMILGRTITGEPVALDVAKTPHLLIAGTTGSGKSVCVNSLICSILYNKSPKEVRIIMVDPKIVELSIYNSIAHLLTPVITEPKKVVKALDWLVDEMTRRYSIMPKFAVRNIEAYNEKIQSGEYAAEKLPYIVLIMDEFADLMTTIGKEIEDKVNRLAAMSRAVGIHIVMATQRPSSEVVTGTLKNNIPARIAFAVSSGMNSRIILDSQGAESLLGRGDMLYLDPTKIGLQRIQGAFLSDSEVEKVVSFVRSQAEPDYLDPELFEDIQPDEDEESSTEAYYDDEEDLYSRAKAICYERKSASASYLQRRMKIGYNKAARFIERMEDEGIVGPAQGSKPREILDYNK